MSAPAFTNLIRFNASAGGTADFVVASAASGCVTPEQAWALNGKVYSYFASASDGSNQAEFGTGAYSTTTHALARTTIYSNYGAKTQFVAAPIVDVFPSPQPYLEAAQPFQSGTAMLFQQTTAPPGWTKITTYNDYALRVVNGTAGTGGNNAFSTTFSYRTSDGASLSIAQLAAHTHSLTIENTNGGGTTVRPAQVTDALNVTTVSSNSTGSGSAHSHTYDMRVLYVDCIIATKT